MDIIQT